MVPLSNPEISLGSWVFCFLQPCFWIATDEWEGVVEPVFLDSQIENITIALQKITDGVPCIHFRFVVFSSQSFAWIFSATRTWTNRCLICCSQTWVLETTMHSGVILSSEDLKPESKVSTSDHQHALPLEGSCTRLCTPLVRKRVQLQNKNNFQEPSTKWCAGTGTVTSR